MLDLGRCHNGKMKHSDWSWKYGRVRDDGLGDRGWNLEGVDVGRGGNGKIRCGNGQAVEVVKALGLRIGGGAGPGDPAEVGDDFDAGVGDSLAVDAGVASEN